MSSVPAVDFAPALRLLAVASVLAAAFLALWWWRQRRAGQGDRRVALAALAAFLTADLIVFGAFTRLTDSGLGCPDWPGCYGAASPWGASAAIDAAERTQPSGPVTVTKAWIEMIHRYLAMTVGALILALTVVLWRARASVGRSGLWALAALVWVLVQGAFGKYTVTLRLYPAVVTAHLLGGMVLLGLLMAQLEALRQPPRLTAARGAGVVLLLLALQIALGGWVSSNYAVLACRGFPQCNGQWWPAADFAQGFTLLRELGRAGTEGYVSFEALVAIQMAHRLFAAVVLAAVLALAWRLWVGGDAASRRAGLSMLGLLALQVLSGLSNVLLDWPLLAALVHTAGAAALVALLVSLMCRASRQGAPAGATLDPALRQRAA
ncbi:MAG: COX15/CtaA family protein [Burkholderiaceae bacterium]|nr:COX15/CtaA family protein [Burkholderiaceae bacterium]